MRIDDDPEKQRANRRKHGLDFSFCADMFRDELSVVVYDRFQDGEHRWHLFSLVGNVLLLAVHTYPDPDDPMRVRIIGFRKATSTERRRYEEGELD